MTVDLKLLIMLGGLAVNLLVLLFGLVKIGRWQGVTESRLKNVECDVSNLADASRAWRKEHETKNTHAFNRFDDRINSLHRSVYGGESGEAIFVSRREFNEFKTLIRDSQAELKDDMMKHFTGVSELIKTYFERAEKERQRIWERLEIS